MVAKQDQIRQIIEDFYIQAIKDGKPVNLRWLAEHSEEIVGEPVPYPTLRMWSFQQNWSAVIAKTLGDSPDLAISKEFINLSRESLLASQSWKEMASNAKAFIVAVKGLSKEYFLIVEPDVSEVYEFLNKHLLEEWDAIKPVSARTTIFTSAMQLKKMLPKVVVIKDDGVSPDAALLEDRQR